jgi:tyrosyl-tRNA synthetase
MILKRYNEFSFTNKINESLNTQGFKVIPNGTTIPKGRVKMGFDPTGPQLHLGHMIGMRMVRKLKEEGSEVHIVLGTTTAQLGDPSGRDVTRAMLDFKTTKANADNLISQVKRIIGDDIEIHYNNEWFDKMTLPEFLGILSKFTVDYLMSRDAFQKRKEAGATIGAHEIIVPLLQGIDSYELKADIEVGGTDQEFNFLLSRDIQSQMGQKPEVCLLAPIINGVDGRKMSKSFHNCIYLNDTPRDVFGKAMSVTDEVMYQWIPIFMEGVEIKGRHPMDLKKELATVVTNEIWPGKGDEERKNFEATVQNKALPTDIPVIDLEGDFPTMVAKVGKVSKSEARRLMTANAVSVNDTKVADKDYVLKSGDILKVGKRNYGKIK